MIHEEDLSEFTNDFLDAYEDWLDNGVQAQIDEEDHDAWLIEEQDYWYKARQMGWE